MTENDATSDVSGEEILNYRNKKRATWKQTAAHFNLSYDAVRSRARRHQKRSEKVAFEDRGDSAYAVSHSATIRTLDQLLEVIDADLSLWQVSRWLVNTWTMGRKHKIVDLTWVDGKMKGRVDDKGLWNVLDNFQVKVWFEPRQIQPYEEAMLILIDEIRDNAPTYVYPDLPKKFPTGEHLLVANLYDAHIGKRSYDGSYTVEKAGEDFIKVGSALAASASSGSKKISEVLFPVGHDILHADNIQGTTTAGTWMEMSGDIRDAIDVVCHSVPKAIEPFAAIAPVKVIPVKSNHDELQVHWLTKFLDAYFTNHPNITVRTKRAERQYYKWGRVGLGLSHKAKPPADMLGTMAVEAREMWADIKWSEWLTGHLHKQRGALYAVESSRGTVIRTIPAMCDLDNYHLLCLYVGEHRAAEAMYYHAENGPAGGFPIFIDEV
jgi:hypothetical protein